MHAKVSQTYRPTVKLTGKRGWYRVQSGTHADVYYETSANHCSCPARKPCRHMRFVRGLNVAFYCRQRPAIRPAALDASTDLELRLASALRALSDTDVQDDSYAVLLRRVDELERAVAAANHSAMRAA